MRIGRWEWDYEFGLNEHKNLFPGIFSDSRSLLIEGKFVKPVELVNEAVKLFFSPGNYQDWAGDPPAKVGTILRNGEDKYLLASVGFPGDALPLILQLLVAGRFQNIRLIGGRMFRHEANVRSFRFEERYEGL